MGILTSIMMGERESRARLANPDSWLQTVFSGGPTDAGITVDETTLTATVFGILEFLKNWLKHKVGVKWL